MVNFDSISEIKQLLDSRNLAFRKRWGQNFLISPGVKDKLISILEPLKTDTVWEIGPGIGSMSVLLSERVQRLVLFEIDPGYAGILRSYFSSREGVTVRQGDFIKTWEPGLKELGKPEKIFGNLPYNSGSVMIGNLIEEGISVEKMVFTLQKEVVDRIVAAPGSKEYSSFSMVVQSMYDPVYHGTIPPGAFFPKPKVISAAVELRPHNRYSDLKNRALLFRLIKDLFSSRRKTIRNTIRGGSIAGRYGADLVLSVFESRGIDTGLRGECLPVGEVAAAAAELERILHQDS